MNLEFSLKKLALFSFAATNAHLPEKIGSVGLSLSISFLLVAFYNLAFFNAAIAIIDLSSIRGVFFLLNIALVLWLLNFIFISLITLPYLAKPLLAFLLIVAGSTAYFMDAYGVVIHRLMIQNAMETDFSETKNLINAKLILYIAVLGVIPTLTIFRLNIDFLGLKQELVRKLKFTGAALITSVLLILCMSADYASFFRNHKNIRQMANPLNVVYATASFFSNRGNATVVAPIEHDAAINALGKSLSKPTLLVLVVGETARADHFSTNGYSRQTNPLLARQSIINFSNVTSCGTETAVSVPCMFSALGRAGYSDSKAKAQEGLLDVIKHAGIDVLWRDNNSSCKGTCNRVDYEDVQHLALPDHCNDIECFDEILLHDLNKKLAAMSSRDKVIVLHQKGSHGPDYADRYPKGFATFTPVCNTNQLHNCSKEEVINAYDNTIHYTDYFLNSAIEWLKQQSPQYNTAFIYLSDHGESLGENGLYLHGMPYRFAPKEQKHVPFLFWFSEDFTRANAIDSQCLQRSTTKAYSHDNLFHTTLGLLNISTNVYRDNLDIVKPCRAL